jgi:hypothetical protein
MASSELHHLVRLRDGVIESKCKELEVVSRSNVDLRRNLDKVESDLVQLYELLAGQEKQGKDNAREVERLRRENSRLQEDLRRHEGRAKAMAAASAQNSRLLILLEQEEKKREEVIIDRDELRADLARVRASLLSADSRAAETEASLVARLAEAEAQAATATDAARAATEQSVAAASALAESRATLGGTVEHLEAELERRRATEYVLSQKLQEGSDEIQALKDESEAKDETVNVLSRQCAALERHLRDTTTALDASVADLSSTTQSSREALCLEKASTAKQAEQLRTIKEQLLQVQQGLASADAARKTSEEQASRSIKRVAECEQALDRAREKIVCLMKTNMKLKSQLRMDATQRQLSKALSEFNRTPNESVDPVGVCHQCSCGSASDFQLLMWSRQQLLRKVIECTATTRMAPVEHPLPPTCISLGACGVGDGDMEYLASALSRAAQSVTELDLSANALSDEGAILLADFLASSSCALEHLDLRYNNISIDGIVQLARGLERSGQRGILSVLVHNEGRIEAFGELPNEPTASCTADHASDESLVEPDTDSSSARKSQQDNAPQSLRLIASIDIQDNVQAGDRGNNYMLPKLLDKGKPKRHARRHAKKGE